MIASSPINHCCQPYLCCLAARHSQARIHTLNSHTAALANTPHSPQRVHSHQLAHTDCTAKSSLLPGQRLLATLSFRGLSEHALELLIVGGVYFVLATAYPATIPVWPAAGFAVGAFVLRGLWGWPAILVASFLAGMPTDIGDVTFAEAFPTLLAISVGNTVEAALVAWLT